MTKTFQDDIVWIFEFWAGRINNNPFSYFTRCKNIRQTAYQFLDNVYVKSNLYQFITIG